MLHRDSLLCSVLRGAVILGGIGAVAMGAGCGWTARDEYRRAQRVTLTASPGDGSTTAFAPEPDQDTLRANTSIASVPDEP